MARKSFIGLTVPLVLWVLQPVGPVLAEIPQLNIPEDVKGWLPGSTIIVMTVDGSQAIYFGLDSQYQFEDRIGSYTISNELDNNVCFPKSEVCLWFTRRPDGSIFVRDSTGSTSELIEAYGGNQIEEFAQAKAETGRKQDTHLENLEEAGRFTYSVLEFLVQNFDLISRLAPSSR